MICGSIFSLFSRRWLLIKKGFTEVKFCSSAIRYRKHSGVTIIIMKQECHTMTKNRIFQSLQDNVGQPGSFLTSLYDPSFHLLSRFSMPLFSMSGSTMDVLSLHSNHRYSFIMTSITFLARNNYYKLSLIWSSWMASNP